MQAVCPCYAPKFVRQALVVVGKAPIGGLAKTRLVPPLSTTAAADLYRAFLLDTLAVARALDWERLTLLHPHGHGPALQSVDNGVDLVEQPAEGLGKALAYAFEHHFALGYEHVVLIGSDNPTITTEPILEADHALTLAADVAIGPARDGGYYLIGMRQLHLGLFVDIEWSTPRVYAQTLQRAHELGLRVHAVQQWYDVDEPADLDLLLGDLRRLPSTVAVNTRAALQRYENLWRRSGAQRIRGSDALGNTGATPAPSQDHD